MHATTWLHCPRISAVCLAALILIGSTFGQEGQPPPGKRDRKRIAKLIDDLANRNPPPVIVNASPPFPPTLRVPLFPKQYDWAEQNRVIAALSKLRTHPTPELWEELVRHSEDNRYSLTLHDDDGNPENRTVGSFCSEMAYTHLTRGFSRYLPTDPNPSKLGRPIWVEISLAPSWTKWRHQRRNKSLAELQIEVCEEALAQLKKVKGVPQEEKRASEQKIQAMVMELKKTKRPLLLPIQGEIDSFSRVEAQDISEAHEKQPKKSKK
jgi:hypothetical protein